MLDRIGKLHLSMIEKLPVGDVSRKLADHCERCPACQWARKHPGHPASKAIQLHGKLCPCWQAWEKHYGDSAG